LQGLSGHVYGVDVGEKLSKMSCGMTGFLHLYRVFCLAQLLLLLSEYNEAYIMFSCCWIPVCRIAVEAVGFRVYIHRIVRVWEKCVWCV